MFIELHQLEILYRLKLEQSFKSQPGSFRLALAKALNNFYGTVFKINICCIFTKNSIKFNPVTTIIF